MNKYKLDIVALSETCRNKNTPVVIGVIYQPSSNESEKLIWLEKFERILTEIYTKWSGVMIIACNFNIDIL